MPHFRIKERALRCVAMAVLALAVGFPTSAYGASRRDVAKAEGLFKSGRAKLAHGDPQGACQDFAASQRLDPSTGTLLNLAICSEQMGKLQRAQTFWEAALPGLSASDERRKPSEEALASLKARIPKITIRLDTGAPDETRVFRNGKELPKDSLGKPLEMDPGRVVFRVEAPGNLPTVRTVALREGTSRVEFLTWKNAPVQVIPEPATPTWAYVAAVTGGGLLVGGMGFGVDATLANEDLKHADPGEKQSFEDRRTRSGTVAAGLGAVGLLSVGVALYGFLALDVADVQDKEEAPPIQPGEIRPVAVGPSPLGLGLWF